MKPPSISGCQRYFYVKAARVTPMHTHPFGCVQASRGRQARTSITRLPEPTARKPGAPAYQATIETLFVRLFSDHQRRRLLSALIGFEALQATRSLLALASRAPVAMIFRPVSISISFSARTAIHNLHRQHVMASQFSRRGSLTPTMKRRKRHALVTPF